MREQSARRPRVLTSCTGILVLLLLLGMAVVAWADSHLGTISLLMLTAAGVWSLASWWRQKRR